MRKGRAGLGSIRDVLPKARGRKAGRVTRLHCQWVVSRTDVTNTRNVTTQIVNAQYTMLLKWVGE